MPPAIAAALIGGGASLIGGILGRHKQKGPPVPPDYAWLQKMGPQAWNKLYGTATGLMDSPYGIPQDIRNRMYNTARGTAEAGYGAAQRGIDRNTALSGLSPGGGSDSRQRYYAGQQMAEGLNQAYSGIDIQDYLAREEQKNRGYNMLFSLTNKSPLYSQIVSQNYWNALNASNNSASQFGNLIGGTAANISQAMLYGNGDQSGNGGGNPGTPYQPGNYDPYSGYNNSNPPYEQSPYTDQGYQGYQGQYGG